MKEFAAALSVLSTSSATTDMRMELAGMVQKGADYYEEGLEDEASRLLDELPDMEVLEERYQEDDKLRQKVDFMLLSLSQVCRVCVCVCVPQPSHRAQSEIGNPGRSEDQEANQPQREQRRQPHVSRDSVGGFEGCSKWSGTEDGGVNGGKERMGVTTGAG